MNSLRSNSALHRPEKSTTLGDESAIGVPFSLVRFFLVDSAASLAAADETYAFGVGKQKK